MTLIAVGVLAALTYYLIARDMARTATDQSLMGGEVPRDGHELGELELERLNEIEAGLRRRRRGGKP